MNEQNENAAPFMQEETFAAVQLLKESEMDSATLSRVKRTMLRNLERTLGVVGYAAKLTGISRRTHYKWMRTDVEYKERVEALNELLLDYAESRLFSYVQKHDFRAITFLLQTKGKSRGYTKYRNKKDEKGEFEFVLKVFNEQDAQFIERMRLHYSNATETELYPKPVKTAQGKSNDSDDLTPEDDGRANVSSSADNLPPTEKQTHDSALQESQSGTKPTDIKGENNENDSPIPEDGLNSVNSENEEKVNTLLSDSINDMKSESFENPSANFSVGLSSENFANGENPSDNPEGEPITGEKDGTTGKNG